MNRLKEIQNNIYKSIINLYRRENTPLNSYILFMKDTEYIPPMFDHGRIYNFEKPNDFIKTTLEIGHSKELHDGAVFVYPNGKVIYGGIIEALSISERVPERIFARGTAGGLMRLLTTPNNLHINRALKCNRDLKLYFNGRTKLIYTAKSDKDTPAFNYGLGMMITDRLENLSNLRFLKMANFYRLNRIKSLSVLAGKMMDVCFNITAHDGFWHYNPYDGYFAGPYLVLPQIQKELVNDTGGMKRLTAKLLTSFHNIYSVILRENSTELLSYAAVKSSIQESLQEELDIIRKRTYPNTVS